MTRSNTQIAVLLVGTFLTSAVSAEELPTVGILYSTKERHSLTYECQPVKGNQLTCEFVQSSVRQKAKAADLPNVIEEALKQFPNEKPPSSEDCSSYRQIVAVLEGREEKGTKLGQLTNLSELEKADLLKVAKSFIAYCDNPTKEMLVSIVRLSHDRDVRTCQVSSHTFTQTFKQLSEIGSGSVWIAQGAAEGPCGIVQLSRFEPEELGAGKSKSIYWKYVARKAVTNPDGELLLGGKCSALDEGAYLYDWRSKEHQLSCDYIQFSPF